MDKHLDGVIRKRMERTVKALRAHRFAAEIVETREELLERIRELIPEGATCSLGGSMTLAETGVQAMLESGGKFRYLDRYAKDANPDEVVRDALRSDVYLTSSNAVTETGALYNVDGRGNRVAALVYGPKKVIVVAGYNKIVPDLAAARERNRHVSAPANTARLHPGTPCEITGKCEDCQGPNRICNIEATLHASRDPERIVVLLMPETLGY